MLALGASLFNFSRNFIGAILIVYLINSGVSLSAIGFGKALQLFVSIILTVPAGKFADKLGNKLSVCLSCLFGIFYLFFLIWPSPSNYYIGECFNGASIAFYMGAYEAWLLNNKKENEQTYWLYSKSQEYSFIAIMSSALIGANFSSYAIKSSIVFFIITFIFFLLCNEKTNRNKNHHF